MFPAKIHRYIFLFGAFSLGFGMMLGAIPTSVPQFILLGNWLIEGNFKNKWQQLRSNKIFWAIVSVFLLHVLGLAYTQNISDGIVDLRVKMPILFLALVFFTSPLSQKEFHTMLACFLLGCLCNTAWCIIYNFVLHTNDVGRDASRFMSHIRLGLYLNMAIACCVYFILRAKSNFIKAALFLLSIYYIGMMLLLGLASGLSTFFILSFFGACIIIYRQRPAVKIGLLALMIIASIAIASYVVKIKNEQLTVQPVKNNTVLKYTPLGREYIYIDTLSQQKENGNFVMINIQMEELKREWQHQFPKDSFSYNPAPHNIKRFDVLLRYMASKGLNKDSAGIAALTATDKANIQKNITNYRYPYWNYLHKRTYELVCEYDEFKHSRNINGHSLTMRLYFWKAALQVIQHHFLIGVGTGDVQDELNNAYAATASPLQPEWHKRPHNQFLTITVALGLIGFLVLAGSIIYSTIQLKKQLPFLYWPFLITALFSFLLEDTLESQPGLTFYAVFNTLFLSMAWFKKTGINHES